MITSKNAHDLVCVPIRCATYLSKMQLPFNITFLTNMDSAVHVL